MKKTATVPEEETGPSGTTKRRPFRREQILQAAVKLFNERGYHATGMNDIGAAVGITGPGIYRHFKNKEEILETAVREAGEHLVARVQKVVAETESPRKRLELLVDNYLDVLLAYPAVSVTVLSNLHVLSDSTQVWVKRRTRLHVEEWVAALVEVRQDISETDARVLVWGVFGLWHAVERYVDDLDHERLEKLLHNMAMAILFAPNGSENGSRKR